MLIHATCVAIHEKAVLLAGAAGAGKSDLALRLLDEGAQLVADDQTLVSQVNGQLLATAPASITGLLEVRHLGLIKVPYISQAPIVLYIDLVRMDEKLDRLPTVEPFLLLDHPVQRLRLPAFAPSTPAKIRAALLYPIVTDP